jgi:hypothetical protein
MIFPAIGVYPITPMVRGGLDPQTQTAASLGVNFITAGDPIVVWCNNKACGYWLEHGIFGAFAVLALRQRRHQHDRGYALRAAGGAIGTAPRRVMDGPDR